VCRDNVVRLNSCRAAPIHRDHRGESHLRCRINPMEIICNGTGKARPMASANIHSGGCVGENIRCR
jgi:hypothetical protein